MYNRAFISADCSMIILRVFIWSTHERLGRNSACSFLIPFSSTGLDDLAENFAGDTEKVDAPPIFAI